MAKDFKDNPAMTWFSIETIEAREHEEAQQTEARPMQASKIEEKPQKELMTKKVLLVMQQSLYDEVQDFLYEGYKETKRRQSFNGYINNLIKEDIKRRKDQC